jgi:hypothetical protein
MGQYANQPDFATRAVGPITPDVNINQTTFLDSAAIYVGSGGNLKVIIAGTAGPTASDAVEFMNIQDGSFVPVIVDYVLPATATAASDLVAIY